MFQPPNSSNNQARDGWCRLEERDCRLNERRAGLKHQSRSRSASDHGRRRRRSITEAREEGRKSRDGWYSECRLEERDCRQNERRAGLGNGGLVKNGVGEREESKQEGHRQDFGQGDSSLLKDLGQGIEVVNGGLVKQQKQHGNGNIVQQKNGDGVVLGSNLKQYVSFYFTNFPAQMSNFYLRKGFEVCGAIGKSKSPSTTKIVNDDPRITTEEEVNKQILQHEKFGAGILCQVKTRHGALASVLTLTKDVVGFVAMLGKIEDDNLSRLFAEYLGVKTMLAIVCRTYEGVKALEMYDKEGCINKSVGLHGLGATIGKPLDGRFLVICLESLRPYAGKYVVDDSQRKLDILNPRLPNGECPSGFIGFAVNMINIDNFNLFCATPSGYGLRETLFYNLFSRLQVYKTRAEMIQALPCIIK
ncbi:unnamed protein product [Trifolium pratense]|uniref:Uncharacterized protein n=1 Tax=Trifolium pratense TaxID=57577 RepID=A0ACB0LD79_TRIPR|nr:unnamed protein product [Trifolium pratense]